MNGDDHPTEGDVNGTKAGERYTREKIGSLIARVHENHKWPSGIDALVERQESLDHYIQLPRGTEYGDLQSQVRPGEILVMFYNHTLRRRSEPDDGTEDDHPVSDNDDSESETNGDDAAFPQDKIPHLSEDEGENEESTCSPIPLQDLYHITSDDTKMVPYADLISHLQSKHGESSGNLRIIEFPTQYYADDFLQATKKVPLKDLVDNPKATMVRVKSSRESAFLRGVTYYPNVPPKQFVSLRNPRPTYASGTFLFVAIPYLGQETLSRARFRKDPLSPPNDNYKKDGIIGRLTAYHTVDSYTADRPSSNSSLNLLEYKFPQRGTEPSFEEWGKVLGNEIEKGLAMTVVHQVWFMVVDDETIAVFRSADDQSGNLPLFRSERETVGAYHGLANMISDTVPSLETKMPDKFSQRVSDLEFLVHTRDEGSNEPDPENKLALKMKLTRFELSAIINVVDEQIEILQHLTQFQLDGKTEQFATVRRTIRATVRDRKLFRSKIELILSKLQESEQRLFECLSRETAKEQTTKISEQLAEVKLVAEASQKAAEASTTAAQASTAAAQASTAAAEASKTAADASTAASDRITKVSERSNKQSEEQGAKITIFTVITTIFTPMSFLTSYWGMNFHDITGTTWKQPQFWILCVPLTIVILLIAWLCAFRDAIRKRLRQGFSSETYNDQFSSKIDLEDMREIDAECRPGSWQGSEQRR